MSISLSVLMTLGPSGLNLPGYAAFADEAESKGKKAEAKALSKTDSAKPVDESSKLKNDVQSWTAAGSSKSDSGLTAAGTSSSTASTTTSGSSSTSSSTPSTGTTPTPATTGTTSGSADASSDGAAAPAKSSDFLKDFFTRMGTPAPKTATPSSTDTGASSSTPTDSTPPSTTPGSSPPATTSTTESDPTKAGSSAPTDSGASTGSTDSSSTTPTPTGDSSTKASSSSSTKKSRTSKKSRSSGSSSTSSDSASTDSSSTSSTTGDSSTTTPSPSEVSSSSSSKKSRASRKSGSSGSSSSDTDAASTTPTTPSIFIDPSQTTSKKKRSRSKDTAGGDDQSSPTGTGESNQDKTAESTETPKKKKRGRKAKHSEESETTTTKKPSSDNAESATETTKDKEKSTESASEGDSSTTEKAKEQPSDSQPEDGQSETTKTDQEDNTAVEKQKPEGDESETPTVRKPKRSDSDSETANEGEEEEVAKKPKRPQSLAEADELLLKNKFEAAEESYRSLITTDDTGDAYAGLAVALAKQNWPKKILEAERIMKKGKEQFAENPNIMAAGGYVSYVHSKSVASPAKRDLYLDAAERLSKMAVKLSPDTVIAQHTLGLVKLAQDDAEGAISPLRKAANMAQDAYSNTLLAEAMLKVDPRDEDAKALIDEALAMDKNFHPARLQKAFYLTSKGKHEEAFTELHSIPRDQRGSDWHKVQGDIYRAQGDGPSALASWKEANRLDPRNPEPYTNLGQYYAARGDGELAIAEYHNSLEILPNDLKLRAELAELALRQDKLDVAETEFRTILNLKDGDPSSLLGLARVFFRKARKEGQYPTGYAELMDKISSIVTEQSVQGQLVKKGAKNLSDKIQLSEAEKALAESPPRFREARQLFSQVITNHKEEPYELLSLGEQAFNDGDLKSAEEAYGYAKENNEVSPRAEQGISKITSQRNEAKRHTELGNATWKLPEIAIDHYKQALIHDPQHPDAYYGLYKLYFRLKKDDNKAVDYAHTFLEASDDNDPLRKEVEDDLSRLKKRVQKENSK